MTIWRMRIECWIPKATNTHRICNTHCSCSSTMVVRSRLIVNVLRRSPVLFSLKWDQLEAARRCVYRANYRLLARWTRGTRFVPSTLLLKWSRDILEVNKLVFLFICCLVFSVSNSSTDFARFSTRFYAVFRDKWVPVTRAWRALSMRMEERPPVWRVAANILNKQSRTADKGWSSSLGNWARC